MNNPSPTTDNASDADDGIVELLHHRAERITVEPDLDRVYETARLPNPDRELITADPEAGRRKLLAMAAALLVAVGLGTAARYRGDAGNDVATSSLIGTATETAPLDGFRADSALRSGELELIVWMHPDASSAEIENTAQTLDDLVGVARFAYVDTAETYEEFSAYYADQPEVIELVEPEMLPTSFRVMSPNPASLEEVLTDRLAGLPGVSAIDVGRP